MSVKISGQVWELDLDPVDKLVLLALADHADHEGNNVRPGNDLLCAKTGLSQPTISAKVKKFTEQGILSASGSIFGRGKKREFSIDLDPANRHQYFIEKEEKKAKARHTFNDEKRQKLAIPLETERYKLTNGKVKADELKVKADEILHDKERARVESSIEPSGNHQEKEEPSPIFEALENIYPGHATNFRTMSELFTLAEKLKATAKQVLDFPGWLERNHPKKADSPFAFKDLFDRSLKETSPQTKRTIEPPVFHRPMGRE